MWIGVWFGRVNMGYYSMKNCYNCGISTEIGNSDMCTLSCESDSLIIINFYAFLFYILHNFDVEIFISEK